MWREKENICCQEVDVVKNKNLEAVTEEQLQAEPRYLVQHPRVRDAWKEGTADFFNTSLQLKSSYIFTESFVVVSWDMFVANVTRSWCPIIRFSFCSNKCNPLSSHAFISWKLVRANSVCIRYVTQHKIASLVFVFFVWDPVVSRSYYNDNVAKSSTVLVKLSVKMYIFSKVQVVIWETLRACYFRSTIAGITAFFFFFFNQDTAFYNVDGRQSRNFCFDGFLS